MIVWLVLLTCFCKPFATTYIDSIGSNNQQSAAPPVSAVYPGAGDMSSSYRMAETPKVENNQAHPQNIPSSHVENKQEIGKGRCATKIVLRSGDRIVKEVEIGPSEGCIETVEAVTSDPAHLQHYNSQQRSGKETQNPHQNNQLVQPVPVQHVGYQSASAQPLHTPHIQYYYPELQRPHIYRPPAPVYEPYQVQKPIQTIYQQPTVYSSYPVIEETYEVPTSYASGHIGQIGQVPCQPNLYVRPHSRSAPSEIPYTYRY